MIPDGVLNLISVNVFAPLATNRPLLARRVSRKISRPVMNSLGVTEESPDRRVVSGGFVGE